MSRINIPLEALTSRLNLQGRFDGVRSQSLANRFANLKPLSEFFDIKRLSKPRDFGELQARVNHNLGYFSSNYALVFVMLAIYSLLTNLLLFFVIVLVIGGMFGIGKLQGRDLDVGFARATTSQLYTGLLVIAVPLGFWASPFATILWLIGASGVVILGHASFLEKDVASSFSEEVRSSDETRPLPETYADSTGLLDGRRYRWSAAPSLPNDTGRPPGALRDDARRRYIQDWELRDPRFEELGTSEDEDGQGVFVDPNSFAARDTRARGFMSDELYFDGYDIGQDRRSRMGMYDQDYGMYDLRYRDQGGWEFQDAVRGRDEELVQSALATIAKARAKGKTNINLSKEEMEALERRTTQQPEPTSALVSPPATPAKAVKGAKVSSRSNSSTNLAAQKTRKRSSTVTSTSSPAKSNPKARVSRKPSTEHAASPLPYPAGPQTVLVQGPDGQPVQVPIYYPPPSPEYRRQQAGGSNPGSRSGSKHSRRESTPPERTDLYAQYSPRYYPPSSMRPPSSASSRSLSDDIDWYPPPPRTRSSSNAYLADYDVPQAMPAAQSRRHVSGPAGMGYPPLRRSTAGSSPLAAGRPPPGYASYSDPAITGGKRSGLSRQMSGGSSGDDSSSGTAGGSDDQGVQVDILEDGRPGGSGYTVTRTGVQPVAVAGTGSLNESRKRRSGRR